jgi:hypothetical protein
MNNFCICWGFTHILTKCKVQEAKFPVKISSGSVSRKDLIPALKVKYPELKHWAAIDSYGVYGLRIDTRFLQ